MPRTCVEKRVPINVRLGRSSATGENYLQMMSTLEQMLQRMMLTQDAKEKGHA